MAPKPLLICLVAEKVNLAIRLNPIVHQVTIASMNITFNDGIVISTRGVSNLGGRYKRVGDKQYQQ